MTLTSLLDVNVLDHGTTRLVTLTGEIDLATAAPAHAALRDALLGESETVVLDLAGVDFMDSTGLHLVLGSARLAAERGVRFVLVPGPPHVQDVFALAGVASEVPFAQSGGRFAR